MSLNLVSEQLLSANGLNHQDLFAILGQLTERRLDYGDLYFQSSYHESWVLEDSIIKDGSYNIDQGVGVRAVSGEKTGFAYADQISKLALEQSAQAARTIVRDTGNGKVQTLGAVEHRALYTSIDPLQSMTREEKLDILRKADAIFREEMALAGLDRTANQYFAALTNMRSVGIMGDERTYDYAIALRSVQTQDFMTATWSRLPYELLDKVSGRIVGEVPHINRVLYDVTSKPHATEEYE